MDKQTPSPDVEPLIATDGSRITQRRLTRGIRVNIAAGALGMVWAGAARV